MPYNQLFEKYLNAIRKIVSFKCIAVIGYGSNVYEDRNSDLDICLIVKDNITPSQVEIIIQYTKNFHEENNLKLDEEISFGNKLIYSLHELDKLVNDFPFNFSVGKYNIPPISKNKDYLESIIMHDRLLINILTTDHIIYTQSEFLKIEIQEYSKKIERLMLETIINTYDLKCLNTNEILQLLYANPTSNEQGENYLGYKNNHPRKHEYLKQWVCSAIQRKNNIKHNDA